MTREEIGEKIIEIATYFEGLHEVKQNAEWACEFTYASDMERIAGKAYPEMIHDSGIA